jgi:hypothetical protein
MARLRFQIRTLLFLVAICALAITVVIQDMRVRRLQAELNAANAVRGRLVFRDVLLRADVLTQIHRSNALVPPSIKRAQPAPVPAGK